MSAIWLYLIRSSFGLETELTQVNGSIEPTFPSHGYTPRFNLAKSRTVRTRRPAIWESNGFAQRSEGRLTKQDGAFSFRWTFDNLLGWDTAVNYLKSDMFGPDVVGTLTSAWSSLLELHRYPALAA